MAQSAGIPLPLLMICARWRNHVLLAMFLDSYYILGTVYTLNYLMLTTCCCGRAVSHCISSYRKTV